MPRQPPQNLRADARRNREIALDAGLELLAEGREVTMDQVADRAGIGRATLYRHFATREELIQAVLARVVELARAAADTAIRKGGTAEDILRRLGTIIVGFGARYLFLSDYRHLSRHLLEPFDAESDPTLAWVRDAHKRGELRSELSPEWIVQVIVALGMAVSGALEGSPADDRIIEAQLADTLVQAFVAEAGRTRS